MSVAATLSINAVANVDKAVSGLNKLKDHSTKTAPALEHISHGKHAEGFEKLGHKLEHMALHAAGVDKSIIKMAGSFGVVGAVAGVAFFAFEKMKEISEKHAKDLEAVNKQYEEAHKKLKDMKITLAQSGMDKYTKAVDDQRRAFEEAELARHKYNESLNWWESENRKSWEYTGKALREYAEAQEQLKQKETRAEAIKSLEAYKEKIWDAIQTENMSAGQADLWKIKAEMIRKGAGGLAEWNKEQENLKKWADAQDALEKRAADRKEKDIATKKKLQDIEQQKVKDQEQANKLLDDLLTKEQKYENQLDAINSLQRRGFISEEQEMALRAKARDDLDKEEKDKAKRIIDESQSKEEKLASKIKDIQDNKFLDEDQKNKAIDKAKFDALEKNETKETKAKGTKQFAGAAVVGTDAGREAILKGMFGNLKDDKVAKNTKATADGIKKLGTILSKSAKIVVGGF